MKSIAFAVFGSALLAVSTARAQDANRTCRLAEGETRVETLAPAINCIDGKADAAVYMASDQADAVTELRRQLAEMQIALGNLQQQVVAQAQADAAFNAQALGRIDTLERELAPFRAAKDAVLAFNRASGTGGAGACPEGWSYFQPAGGRMIVGAGVQHENKDGNGNPLAKYAAFSDDTTESKINATGGEERHLLTEAEMPSHSHAFTGHQVTRGNAVPDLASPRPLSAGGAVDRGSYTPSGDIAATGGNQPHNNMPPYVALYYCKRD